MRTNARRRFFFGDLCSCLLTDSVRLLPNNLLRSHKQHVRGSATGHSLPLQEILNVEKWVAVRGMLLFFEVYSRYCFRLDSYLESGKAMKMASLKTLKQSVLRVLELFASLEVPNIR